ncbi:condensation domain-containing protein, partial [Micromonospora sp. NPDC049799]|uniref:condensation domain-containing protein n=1 Tax=Micromonospora sp. NPDC049799 TaxID=3154741 RepID=UPI0033D9E0A2
AAVWREVLGVPVTAADSDFLTLGGDSLLAVRCATRLAAATGRPVRPGDLFAHPTVAALATHLDALAAEPAPAGEPAGPVPAGPAPLSAAQSRLWFLHQLAPDDTSYLLAFAVRFDAPLDADRLARALRRVVDRHPALRTVFPSGPDGPVQHVRPTAGPPPVVVPPDEGTPLDERLTRLTAEATRAPMDLATGPLLRAHLVPDDTGRAVALLLVVHHIVCDDWSFGLIVRELARAYDIEGDGQAVPESPAAGPAAFALAQRDWLAGPAGRQALADVLDELRGAPDLLDLPAAPPDRLDRRAATAGPARPPSAARPGRAPRSGAALRTTVVPATADAVRELAR